MARGLCQKHYDADKYTANPEKSREQHRRFIAKNPDYNSERRKKNIVRYKAIQKKSREKDIEHSRELERECHQRNKDRRNAYSRAYRAKNLEAIRKMQREWVAAHPAQHCARVAARNAAKRRATPVWANGELDQFIVEEMYDLAERRTVATGFKWSVDHMVPLKSKTVCGLHCSANLQVIPHSENQKKGNRTWPDMP